MKKNLLLFAFLIMTGVASLQATPCPNATSITPYPVMPYTQTLVCGSTDDINSGNATVCGSSFYLGGQEAVYVWTPSANFTNVTIAYSGVNWSAVILYAGCPTSGGTCVANITSSASSKTLVLTGTLTAGTTYYLVFDTWPTPNSPCPGTFTLNGTPDSPAPPPTPTEGFAPACSNGTTTLDLLLDTAAVGTAWYWQSSATGTSTAIPYTGPRTISSNGTYYARTYNSATLLWSFFSSSITVIDFPAAISASVVSQTSVTCYGGNNGAVRLSAYGGAGGYSYSWTPTGGTSFSATSLSAGVYTLNITDANNCTGHPTVAILQAPANTASLTIYACSYYMLNGNAYTHSGTYFQTLSGANVSGCDSTIQLNLTIGQPVSTVKFSVLCHGYTMTTGPNTYSATGNYTDVLTGSTGCDSTVYTNLIVLPVLSHTQSPFVCYGQSLTIGPHTYSASGTYSDLLTSSAGCDSTVFTNLTVLPLTSFTQSPSVCHGSSLTIGANTYTASGTYSDVLISVRGCDSTVITHLTVLPETVHSQSVSVCHAQSFVLGTHTYTASGTYTDVMTASNGCDSTVITNLTVRPVIVYTQFPVLCYGHSLTIGASTYTAAGTYTNLLQTSGGCDSTVITHLTVSSTIHSSQSFYICQGQSLQVGANTYSNSGSFTNTLTSVHGCDSIASVVLTVYNLPFISVTNVTICAGETATLTASGGNTYSWSTSQTGPSIQVAPAAAQNYTVIGTDLNSCSNSAVALVDVDCALGLATLNSDNDDIIIYPNPAGEKIYFHSSPVLKTTLLEVYDIAGRKVLSQLMSESHKGIDISGLPNGVYEIRILDNNRVIHQSKLIREQ